MVMIPDADREFLRNKFNDELQNPVTILAFTKRAEGITQPGLECEFCTQTEQLMAELGELSDKVQIEVREYSPDDQMVKDMGISMLPALVIQNDGERCVRYFGIPGGFEFSSLIDDIVDVSRNSTHLSQESKDKIRKIERDVHIEVFVTPTCPYCPPVVRMAHQMAIENPKHILADAIEAAEFPYLVSKYGIGAVPTVVINGEIQIQGGLPEFEFADRVADAAS